MPQCLPADSVGTMASLMPLSPYLSPTVLLLVSCDLGFVRADRPPSPVNVTVTHLRANSATVSWDVPEGNIVIGYSISQQRQNGPGQRVIREVNTTTRACALWGLAEDSDYTVQVRSIGLRGESPPGPRVHFRTLKGSDRLPSNSSSPGEGLSYSSLPKALDSLAIYLLSGLLFTSPKQAESSLDERRMI